MNSSSAHITRNNTAEKSDTASHNTAIRTPFFGSKHHFFKANVQIQPSLTVNAPNDIYEKEADAMADKVMRMPEPQIIRAPQKEEKEPMLKAETTRVQRMCTECEEEQGVHRKPLHDNSTAFFQRKESDKVVNNRIVTSLKSTKNSGKPLPDNTRNWMENRFGTDFSGVNIHTDTNAVQLSRDLNARAFTYGSEIYFNGGEFSPETYKGKRLLAHELTHVVQQNSNLSERSTVQRSVRTNQTNCPANTNNAPADPVTALQGINDTAVRFARGTARLLDFSALLIQAGDQGFVENEYQRAFGFPQASGGGFVNRLTGQIRPTRDIALSEEMNLFSERFELVADFLEQPIAYRCDAPLSWGSCNFSACDANDNAGACTGTGAIKICPNFWNHGNEAQAGILIHEVTHIYWAGATHNLPSNLRLSQCYEELVARIYGFNAQSQFCPVP